MSHEELSRLAAAEPPGCSGVSFLPYLAGERTPNWPHASGALVGLRPGQLACPGLLYRAALEGVTFSLLAGYRRMAELGIRGTALYVVGGGSRSPTWRHVLADAFDLPLRFPLEPESAALGAALQAAAVATGADVAEFVEAHRPPLAGDEVLPTPAGVAAMAVAFRQHLRWSEALFGGGSSPK